MTTDISGFPKKRGRPRNPLNELLAEAGISDNFAFHAALVRLDPAFRDELVTRAQSGECISQTLVECVSHVPPAEQRQAFGEFQAAGIRRSRRLVSAMQRPPTPEKMARSIARFIRREYPTASLEDVRDALTAVYEGRNPP